MSEHPERLPIRYELLTAWAQTTGIARAIYGRRGYNCLQGCSADCPHEPKAVRGIFGRNDDEYSLVVRTPVSALALTLMMPFCDGTRTYNGPPWDVVRAAWLQFCSRMPTTTAELLAGPSPCLYQADGLCSFTKMSGLQGQQLLEAHGLSPEDPAPRAVVRLILAATGLWAALDASLLELESDAAKAFGALPQRCPQCNGKGVLS